MLKGLTVRRLYRSFDSKR